MDIEITKIKISKDRKTGEKFAAIQISRIVGQDDEYEGDVAKAINQMADNTHIEVVRLSVVEEPRMLTFSGANGKPCELVKSCALEKFKLTREATKTGSVIVLAFEFSISLAQAKRWIIPSIGDTASVSIENPQASLPMPRGKSTEDHVQ